MTGEKLGEALACLKGETAKADRYLPLDVGTGSLQLAFSGGSHLRAEYWRVVRDGKAGVSSFDDQQQYGLPSRIDAILELQDDLQGKRLRDATLDNRTGDLSFRFEGNLEIQVFSFTGFEDWEIKFADGSGEYSNYARPYAGLHRVNTRPIPER